MNFAQAQALVGDTMQQVDDFIIGHLQSDVALINQLSSYIINSGGKRLRPQIVLLVAGAARYEGPRHVDVAAIIECIHTATLLHDDVVDASAMRRGNDTANAMWGNEAAVLVGDFLYSRAFEMMVAVGSMRVMEILAGTTNVIAEGEVLQLLNIHDPDTTEQAYLKVIRAKTARLFAAAAQLGAVLAGLPEAQEQALAAYGMHLGTAFQLVDDILDYSSDTGQMGKNPGEDIAEGKPTLPLILAMQRGDRQQAALIHTAIQRGGRELLGEVLEVIAQTGVLEESRRMAVQEAEAAIRQLACLDDSAHKEALAVVARAVVERFA